MKKVQDETNTNCRCRYGCWPRWSIDLPFDARTDNAGKWHCLIADDHSASWRINEHCGHHAVDCTVDCTLDKRHLECANSNGG